jgi:hypothetical protein
VLPCRGGEALLRRLFEPLGYEVEAERAPARPDASPSGARAATSTSRCARARAARGAAAHLYVLIPVLDDDKHYWVGDDEVEKLLARGEGWLAPIPSAS